MGLNSALLGFYGNPLIASMIAAEQRAFGDASRLAQKINSRESISAETALTLALEIVVCSDALVLTPLKSEVVASETPPNSFAVWALQIILLLSGS